MNIAYPVMGAVIPSIFLHLNIFKPMTYFKLLLLMSVIFTACAKQPRALIPLSEQPLIPKPVELNNGEGYFSISPRTVIVATPQLQNISRELNSALVDVCGLELRHVDKKTTNAIILQLTEGNKNAESYQMKINKKQILISSASPGGLFYGVQTLKQMLVAVNDSSGVNIAGGTIKDHPRYPYRGMMLDVARHFYSVDEVKQVIDYLSMYKMNKLHLHLCDDQGWRIEIKSRPLLTEKGAISQVGGGDGGFYTQDDFKEIVRYAQERFITIIPEIEMPGHCHAALYAYPELSIKGADLSTFYTGTEVGFSSFDANNEEVYRFIDDVIKEVAAISPGEYLHIGGDETHATAPEDFIKLMNRAQKIVKKHGKKTMAWADIAEADLAEHTVAQFWKTTPESVQKAAEKDAKILMSPADYVYLDMKYDSTSALGLHWAGYVEVDKSYSFEPEDFVEGLNADLIIGIEAALWGETVRRFSDLQWLTFPRLSGVAEMAWTPASLRNWDEYRHRLLRHYDYLNHLGINYYHSPTVSGIQ